MLKRILSVIVIVCLLFVCACSNSSAISSSLNVQTTETPSSVLKEESSSTTEKPAENSSSEVKNDTSDEALKEEPEEENSRWDYLPSLGMIETENGLFTVSLTFPADYVGSDTTQETLDAGVKEGRYVSAKLNDDGSVTYKLTKAQHKAMLNDMTEALDSSLNDLIADESYSFTDIKHNDDFTHFDIHVSGETLNLYDSFSVLVFYMCGNMYNIFTGNNDPEVTVSFYSPSGNIIETASSANMGQ